MSSARRLSSSNNDDVSSGTTNNKIVEWINEAALSNDLNAKCEQLRKVQEVLINSPAGSSLLDNFLEEVLGFQSDRNADVRKFIVGFIEEACKKDPDILPRVVVNVNMLLQDSSIQVQKRVIQALGVLYKLALKWLSKARTVTDKMEAAWEVMTQMKQNIMGMVDNDNDGIRTLSVKFLESVILIQTYAADGVTVGKDNDFSLDDVPFTLKIARRRRLEEEANEVFDLLVTFHGSAHISSVNLMTCMGSLVHIARLRPQFVSKVVIALERLHINLPPTLSKSQVSSVRKHLKLQLLNLLRLPASSDFHNNITTLLTDLGATYQEVARACPKPEELRKHKEKRKQEAAVAEATSHKKPRLDVDAVDTEHADDDKKTVVNTAVDVSEAFILERLSPELAAQLVMASMHKLPDVMPPHFSATYTPIAAAGTAGQIRHVARLMATQLTASSLGPGAKQTRKTASKSVAVEEVDEERKGPALALAEEKLKSTHDQTTLSATGAKLSRVSRLKTLKLSEIAKPTSEEVRKNNLMHAVQRICQAEKPAVEGGATCTRGKIIANMAATFSGDVRRVILAFIAQDMKARLDLGISWLYEEHSYLQGFNRFPLCLKQHRRPNEYNFLLCDLLTEVMQRSKLDAQDRGELLERLYLEVPVITDEAMVLLKDMCCDESKAVVGLRLLRRLVVQRPLRQMQFLNALLIHTSHENAAIRDEALSHVVALYQRPDVSMIIEEYAKFYLGFLKLPMPPDVLFGVEKGRPTKLDTWTEETVRVCLYLLLALLPHKHRNIHDLAEVYVVTSGEIKRNILRLLEPPVRGMGMDSPDLLSLLEQCPKGAETLVTRIVHILTDRAPPSAELVAKVRDLYKTRVSDVRFLIPVLNGLTRDEVIAALPKLMKLNPAVVKEVFNRLLGTQLEGRDFPTPIHPADLLVALHTIDTSKCELKLVIKATSLCFAERHVYTQEVLAVVLQQLMELTPLPMLLMRTVIQALSHYPRLIGFVMNILQRLIVKQVWKQKKVWEGFIKCCQRTLPQSFQVLLQLPAPQLAEVLSECPDMKKPLLDHVTSFTENQKKHVPKAVMDVIFGNKMLALEDSQDSNSSAREHSQKETGNSAPKTELRDPPPPGLEVQ